MSAAGDRSRRYRERQRAGLVRLELWLDRLELAEALHRAGYLNHPDNDDRADLEAALQSFLAGVTRDDDELAGDI